MFFFVSKSIHTSFRKKAKFSGKQMNLTDFQQWRNKNPCSKTDWTTFKQNSCWHLLAGFYGVQSFKNIFFTGHIDHKMESDLFHARKTPHSTKYWLKVVCLFVFFWRWCVDGAQHLQQEYHCGKMSTFLQSKWAGVCKTNFICLNHGRPKKNIKNQNFKGFMRKMDDYWGCQPTDTKRYYLMPQ